MANRHYRRRPQHAASEDLLWLRNVRERMRLTVTETLTQAEAWPFRADTHNRVLKALGVLQHALHGAIVECREAVGVPADFKETEWLGFPPPRR